jgi:hypothetical protein
VVGQAEGVLGCAARSTRFVNGCCMPKSPKWEDECRSAVVNGDAAAMKRALALGLPIGKPIRGFGDQTVLH